MHHGIITFVRKLLFILTFVSCTATLPAADSFDIQKALAELHQGTTGTAQTIIDYMGRSPNDQALLIQLLQPCTPDTEQSYLDLFYQRTSWEQWEIFVKWMEQIDIPAEHCKHYIKNIFQHKRAFARYISLDGLVQKIIDYLHTHAKQVQEILLPENMHLLDDLYLVASKAQQTVFQEWVKKYLPNLNLKASITKLLLLQQSIPHFAIPTNFSNTKQTQSKPHFFHNFAHTLTILNRCPLSVKKTLLAAYRKEQAERAKGHYLFYHAQQWHLHFSADIYKQLWNIVHRDTVGDDFTFFRYNQQTEAPDIYFDHLFMNHALFGNARNNISCSATYFLNNHSVRPRIFSSEDLCAALNAPQIYKKYASDFQQLEALHQVASNHGNLLLISVPADKLNFVRPVIDGGPPRTVPIEQADGTEYTDDTKLILDTLIAAPHKIPDSDDIEYTMPLTTEYALDPHNGPRVYSFNAADPVKLKAYEQARDTLFAKIKKDTKLLKR